MDEQKQPFNPLLAVLAALAALFFVFPLIGMITGAPWGNVFGIITGKSSLDTLGLSIIASLASTVIALLFGFPLAWILARNTFRGKAVVRGLTTLPMVLPPVVGGIALLLAYGRRGFIGEPLDRPRAPTRRPRGKGDAGAGPAGPGGRLDLARPSAMSGGQQQRVAMALRPGDRAEAAAPRRAPGRARRVDQDRRPPPAPRGPAPVRGGERAGHPRPARRRGARRPEVRDRGRQDRADRDAGRRRTSCPRSRYVADLVGVNLLQGTARGTVLEIDGGGQIVTAVAASGPVLATVPPTAVAVSRRRPEGHEPNTWAGQISAVGT